MVSKVFYANYEGFKDVCSDKSELRDTRGVLKTQSLFLEFKYSSDSNKYPPFYTLREYEREGLPSAYIIYMTSIDEADAAMKLVGSMHHWRKLCTLKWFMEGVATRGFPGLESWRRDMKNRDDTQAKKILMEQAEEGSVSAARALKDYGSQSASKKKKKKGREDEGQVVIDFQAELNKLKS